MSMGNILHAVIIYPLQMIIEVAFQFINDHIGVIPALIGVSLIVSFLTLPLYLESDRIQKEESEKQKSLSAWSNHIKKTFRGNERFMMLQTYYRQNGYNPALSPFKGMTSLLLEIPFFIAAYGFLSKLELLNGVSFFLIKDLGQPDRILSIGKFGINVLPIIMTLVNVLSSIVYLKDAPLKSKIQVYGFALIFLVLLYNSPAGLVVYWICNNLFSLVKNLFYKFKNPVKVLFIMGVTVTTGAFIMLNGKSGKWFIISFFLMAFMWSLPLLLKLYNRFFDRFLGVLSENKAYGLRIFLFASIGMMLLTGLVIPSNIIVSSPYEFALNGSLNPNWYIWNSVIQAFGLFVFWPFMIRLIFDKKPKIRVCMDLLFLGLLVCSLLNAFVFPVKAGLLNQLLQYAEDWELELGTIGIYRILGNLISIAIIFLVAVFISAKWPKPTALFCGLAGIGLLGLGLFNAVRINNGFKQYSEIVKRSDSGIISSSNSVNPIFHLSKTGKNVIVFGLDRGAGFFVEDILDEREELKDIYSGFVFYPNTVSYNDYTLAAQPPLYGGYEYTPARINLADKPLLTTREEAISLLPRIFSGNGYSVVMTDMPWVGETSTSDFFFMDHYEGDISSYHLDGRFSDLYLVEHSLDSTNEKESIKTRNKRNFLFNSLTSILPYLFRGSLYHGGDYLSTSTSVYNTDTTRTLNAYSSLYYLPALTEFDGETDAFVYFYNLLPHEPNYLDKPDYTYSIDNAVDDNLAASYDATYDVNAASLILIGKWINYLKENGVYDNTRIIISADHGAYVYSGLPKNGGINPMLLFKDFGADGPIRTDYSFMTNADVPILSVTGLIDNPVNEATGKNILEEVDKDNVFVELTYWTETTDVDSSHKIQVNSGDWYYIHDDIYEPSYWQNIDEKTVYDRTRESMEGR